MAQGGSDLDTSAGTTTGNRRRVAPRKRRRSDARDISPNTVTLFILGLLLVAFIGYRIEHRNDVAEARTALRKMTAEISLPGSTGPPITEVRERDCRAGQPRRAIRSEQSTLAPSTLETQLSGRLGVLGWTTQPEDDTSESVGLHHYLNDEWELEVQIKPSGAGSAAQLVLSKGSSSLSRCYD